MPTITVTDEQTTVLKALVDAAIAKVEADGAYTLRYAVYDERLFGTQITRMLGGEYNTVEEEIIETWDLDDYTGERIRELIPDRTDRDLCAEAGLLEPLVDAIMENDDSDIIPQLIRNTFGQLLRYEVASIETGYSSTPTELRKSAKRIARLTGIDYMANRDALWELVTEASYGGTLYVLWYGDVDDLLARAADIEFGAAKPGGHITWTDGHLLILDLHNGSGHDVKVTGTIRRPLDTAQCSVDEKGNGGNYGYSWTDVCDPVASYYRNDPTIDTEA